MLDGVIPDKRVGGFPQPDLAYVEPSPETDRKEPGRATAKRSGQTEASRRYAGQPSFTIHGKGQTGADVVAREVGEVMQDLVLGHAHPTDARLAAHFARLDGDELAVIRCFRLASVY